MGYVVFGLVAGLTALGAWIYARQQASTAAGIVQTASGTTPTPPPAGGFALAPPGYTGPAPGVPAPPPSTAALNSIATAAQVDALRVMFMAPPLNMNSADATLAAIQQVYGAGGAPLPPGSTKPTPPSV